MSLTFKISINEGVKFKRRSSSIFRDSIIIFFKASRKVINKILILSRSDGHVNSIRIILIFKLDTIQFQLKCSSVQ